MAGGDFEVIPPAAISEHEASIATHGRAQDQACFVNRCLIPSSIPQELPLDTHWVPDVYTCTIRYVVEWLPPFSYAPCSCLMLHSSRIMPWQVFIL